MSGSPVQHWHLSRPTPGTVRLTLHCGHRVWRFDLADQPRLAAAFLRRNPLALGPPFRVTADWPFDCGTERTVFGQLCRALDRRPREGLL